LPNQVMPEWSRIHTIIFDFDGVFTDNKVWIDQDGRECVRCDRGDGLAFDLLRGFVAKHAWDLRYFILSKEKNRVVSARASKLQVECRQGVSEKTAFIQDYLKSLSLKYERPSAGLLYVGNDLNDYGAMKLAGLSVAPSDAHPLIRDLADMVLPEKGGEGFVRSFIERLLHVDKLSAEDIEELFKMNKEADRV